MPKTRSGALPECSTSATTSTFDMLNIILIGYAFMAVSTFIAVYDHT